MRKRQRKKIEQGTRRRRRRIVLAVNRWLHVMMRGRRRNAAFDDAVRSFDEVNFVVYSFEFAPDKGESL